MSLVIIGGGNMGKALAQTLISKGTLSSGGLCIVEIDAKQRRTLMDELGCLVIHEVNEHISRFQTVMIAVKPQIMKKITEEISPWLQEHQLVISIMAGITTDQLSERLKHEAIVRVMPNTPAQIAESMTAFYARQAVNQDQLEEAQRLLKSMGKLLQVNSEDTIDAVTAVSGSGPAYLFYLAEKMITAAQKLGFEENEANLLVQQTLKGASLLWEKRQVSAKTLREQVTSPGGTTEAAIRSFEKNSVGDSIIQGINCAYQRARELGNK